MITHAPSMVFDKVERQLATCLQGMLALQNIVPIFMLHNATTPLF